MEHLLLAILLATCAVAQVRFSDLKGNYRRNTMVNVSVCGANLNIVGELQRVQNDPLKRVVLAENFIFDGLRPCSRSLPAVEEINRGPTGIWVNISIEDWVDWQSKTIYCGGNIYFHRMKLARAYKTFELNDSGILSTLEKNEIYLEMWAGDTSDTPCSGCRAKCVYHKIVKDNETIEPSAGSGNSEDPTIVLWAWLGPLLGAAATIVAALIGLGCFWNRRPRIAEVSADE